ncbi:NAD(P)/FAD-dependent oxidoreductase, partial [bacterium]
MESTCAPSAVPSADDIDLAGLKERYRQEREKRLQSDGGAQYVQPKGDFENVYLSDPHMPVTPRDSLDEELEVAVLGGGFGGILTSYYLTQAGITNFRNIDHAGDFGGVWYWNRYPGIQCDNDAYCYLPLLEETGFLPSQKFSEGAEVYGYCRLMAEKFGFADKRVAIIGTGATSIQIVPYLGRYAKELYVAQRTPPSVDERPNPPTDLEWAQTLQPGWQQQRRDNFHRGAMEVFQQGETDEICDIWTEINRNLLAELAAEGWPDITPEEFAARRELMDYRVMERLRRRVAEIVEDDATAELLKPYFRAGCKRPLSSDSYYPTFNRPNVHLLDVSATKGVQDITEKGFIANGVEYEVDAIIFASGFEVTSSLERRWGIGEFTGRNGVSIYDHWREGPLTLHGTMTHNFPNQFYIGYIQGALNASVTEQFGQQAAHIAHVIAAATKQGAKVVEPSLDAQEAYVSHFSEAEVDTSAFQRECLPSYFNDEGKVKAPWALFRVYGPGWHAFQD